METGVTTQNFMFTGGNNQVNSYSYDAAGNLLNDGVHAYTYDDENRIATATLTSGGTETYNYDAEGRRVRKTNGSTPEEYVYDKDGEQIGEMQSDGSFNRIELYADGRHIATYYAANGQAYFIHNDWLGTERARSTYQGAPYETCTSLPFGDSLTCIGTDVSPLHFTGKMRDTETNLDYFGARYLSSGMGRWMSPDWADKPTNVPYANFSNPQGLNLYGYLRNNPLTMQDINGHGDWYDTHGKRIGNDGVDDHTINIADHIAMSSDGTLVDAMNSGVPIRINQAEGKAIHSAVDRSNKKGPTDSEGGMHEEGFTEEGGVITPKAPGPSIKPGDKVAEITNISTGHETVDMHVHPRGDSTTNVGQSPSSADMNGASNFSTTYIQAGAASNKVNIYNMQGVIATVPLSAVPQ